MGLYLTSKAIRWSVNQIALLPKNQTALLYFLIFARCPVVDRTNPARRRDFEEEFYRYFGGPIKGEGVTVYNPFGKEWKEKEYINSTVYGHLLLGSYKWTEGDETFFSRTPKGSGWPASFCLTDDSFNNLIIRDKPPYLRFEHRLPLVALTIYYFRFTDLTTFEPKNQNDLVTQYRNLVVSKHPRLCELFKEGPTYFGSLFVPEPLSEAEKLSCFPPAPFSTEGKTRILLYASDVEYIKTRLKKGRTIADYIRSLLKRAMT